MLRFSGLLLVLISLGFAQVFPEGIRTAPFQCPPSENQREPQNETEAQEFALRAKYREVLPAYLTALGDTANESILMPVEGVKTADVTDTWGAARAGGRFHEGQDIFASAGTPIYSATEGFVYRVGSAPLGGNIVTVVGAAGHRYYYAHLQSFANGLQEGQYVTPDTLLGFVGNTGNARSTPPHLHFGIYVGDENPCNWNAIDPLPFIVNR